MPDKTASEPNGGKGQRQNQRRKATLEQMRKEQQRQERRKTFLLVGIAALTGLAIIGTVTFALYRQGADVKRGPSDFGVPAAAAGCDPEIAEDIAPNTEHVQPGVRVEYATAPAISGQHDEDFLAPPQAFYDSDDVPPVEKLVHSLEHGHFILWYDPALPEDQKDEIQALSRRMTSAQEPTQGKFIAAPWPGAEDNRPPLPPGKPIAFTRWGAPAPQGAGKTWRVHCAQLSGEAAKQFADRHPPQDAPEPGAA